MAEAIPDTPKKREVLFLLRLLLVLVLFITAPLVLHLLFVTDLVVFHPLLLLLLSFTRRTSITGTYTQHILQRMGGAHQDHDKFVRTCNDSNSTGKGRDATVLNVWLLPREKKNTMEV